MAIYDHCSKPKRKTTRKGWNHIRYDVPLTRDHVEEFAIVFRDDAGNVRAKWKNPAGLPQKDQDDLVSAIEDMLSGVKKYLPLTEK